VFKCFSVFCGYPIFVVVKFKDKKMDDLDLYELFAGVEVLEQIEENANAAPRHEHKAVNPFIGKLEFF